MHVDLQCGACGSLSHRGEPAPRFCTCCGAAYDRYCIKCKKKVDMFFEEWWPGEEECIRTYTPAKRCPQCNAGLEVGKGDPVKDGSSYKH
jgi:hypothetical protein